MDSAFYAGALRRAVLEAKERHGWSAADVGRRIGLTGHFARVLSDPTGGKLLTMRPTARAALARLVGFPLPLDDPASRVLLPYPAEKWDVVSWDDPAQAGPLVSQVADAKDYRTCSHAVESHLLPDPLMDWFDFARKRRQGWDDERIRTWYRAASGHTDALRRIKGRQHFLEWVICRAELFRVAARKQKRWVGGARKLMSKFQRVSAVGVVHEEFWVRMRDELVRRLGHRWHGFSVVNVDMAILELNRDVALVTHDLDTVRTFRDAFQWAAQTYVPQQYFAPRARVTPWRMMQSGRETRARLRAAVESAAPFGRGPQGAQDEEDTLTEYLKNAW